MKFIYDNSPANAARGCVTNAAVAVAIAADATLGNWLDLEFVHGAAKSSGSNDGWIFVGFGVENANEPDAKSPAEMSALVIIFIVQDIMELSAARKVSDVKPKSNKCLAWCHAK